MPLPLAALTSMASEALLKVTADINARYDALTPEWSEVAKARIEKVSALTDAEDELEQRLRAELQARKDEHAEAVTEVETAAEQLAQSSEGRRAFNQRRVARAEAGRDEATQLLDEAKGRVAGAKVDALHSYRARAFEVFDEVKAEVSGSEILAGTDADDGRWRRRSQFRRTRRTHRRPWTSTVPCDRSRASPSVPQGQAKISAAVRVRVAPGRTCFARSRRRQRPCRVSGVRCSGWPVTVRTRQLRLEGSNVG